MSFILIFFRIRKITEAETTLSGTPHTNPRHMSPQPPRATIRPEDMQSYHPTEEKPSPGVSDVTRNAEPPVPRSHASDTARCSGCRNSRPSMDSGRCSWRPTSHTIERPAAAIKSKTSGVGGEYVPPLFGGSSLRVCKKPYHTQDIFAAGVFAGVSGGGCHYHIVNS
jgi:hypothetical protein